MVVLATTQEPQVPPSAEPIGTPSMERTNGSTL
jgi:hypothetical protein